MPVKKKQVSATEYFPEDALTVDNLTPTGAFAGMEPEAEKVIEQIERVIDDIPLDQLTSNPFQPRKHFDQAELDGLAASIKEHGVIQRIIVRRSSHQSGKYEIIAGERRWRASRIAGLSTCPAEILRECSDEKMRQVALLENIQRVDLTPLELAESYQELTRIDKNGRQLYSIRALAETLGKNKSYVEDHLRILRVPPEVRLLLVEDPKVSLRVISEIGSIESAPDRADLIKEVRQRNENGWNTQDVIKLVKSLKQSSPIQPQQPGSQASSAQKNIPHSIYEPSQSHDTNGAITESLTDKPSVTLQLAKFKLSWEKRHHLVQKTLERILEEQPTYTDEQSAFIRSYFEQWSEKLQEVNQKLPHL